MPKNNKVISLFSGCGGLDLGFKMAGYDIIWANEFDEQAAQTYRSNIGDHVVVGDIRTISEDDIPKDAEILIGGFPCQGFSMAGKRLVTDERNFLYKEYKRVLEASGATHFVAENVRGLLSIDGGKVFNCILQEFEALGFHVSYQLLHADEYGVPQSRQRVIIYGSKHSEEPLVVEKVSFRKTVREAFQEIPRMGESPNHILTQRWPESYDVIMEHIGLGQQLSNARHGVASVRTWDIPTVYGETTEKERSYLDVLIRHRRLKKYGKKDGNALTTEVMAQLLGWEDIETDEVAKRLQQKGYLIEKQGKYDITKATFTRFRRISWDKPAPTILTNFDNPRNYIHPEENRPLTVREAATLQSFPLQFVFHGDTRSQYRQVGNAVPPLLAYKIAVALKENLSKLN